MNLFEHALKLVNGGRILSEWVGSGGVVVEPEKSQSRADVCIKCERNVPGGALLGKLAEIIKEQVELKNALNVRVRGEKKLGKCDVCQCQLKLKVHIPIERIRPQPGDNFPPNCWILAETK